MLHTFVAIVQDKPGTLTRVASLFRRLNINIVSLTVGESERPDTSRMTIVCEAHEHAAHRIRASLYKLETTVEVDDARAEDVGEFEDLRARVDSVRLVGAGGDLDETELADDSLGAIDLVDLDGGLELVE